MVLSWFGNSDIWYSNTIVYNEGMTQGIVWAEGATLKLYTNAPACMKTPLFYKIHNF